MKLIKVYWIDAASDSDWTEIDKAKKWGRKEEKCVSVGWLIEKNKTNIVIASSKGGKDYGDKIKIPVNSVNKIEELTETNS